MKRKMPLENIYGRYGGACNHKKLVNTFIELSIEKIKKLLPIKK
jgi:hypothetical protein